MDCYEPRDLGLVLKVVTILMAVYATTNAATNTFVSSQMDGSIPDDNLLDTNATTDNVTNSQMEGGQLEDDNLLDTNAAADNLTNSQMEDTTLYDTNAAAVDFGIVGMEGSQLQDNNSFETLSPFPFIDPIDTAKQGQVDVPEEFPNYTYVGADNLTECFSLTEQFKDYVVLAQKGNISVFSVITQDIFLTRTEVAICKMIVKVPRGQVIYLELLEKPSSSVVELSVQGPKPVRGNVAVVLLDSTHDVSSRTAYSFGSKVDVMLTVRDVKQPVSFSLQFRGVAEKSRPRMRLVYSDSETGYLQTPEYDGRKPYPTMLDECVTIIPPFDLNILISLPLGVDLDRRDERCVDVGDSDFLAIYRTDDCVGDAETTLNVGSSFKRSYERKLSLRFVSDRYTCGATGFLLFFTLFEQSALPQQLSDGKWNCSVPNWADFQQHFLCDLEVECAGGEDLFGCPFLPGCAPLGFSSSTKNCYSHGGEAPSKGWSWYKGRQVCLLRNADLVSVETSGEREDMWRMVHFTSFPLQHQHPAFYIGLTLAEENMYQSVFKWVTGNMAYDVAVHNVYGDAAPSCGVLEEATVEDELKDLRVVSVRSCGELFHAHVLCERKAKLQAATSLSNRPQRDPETPSAPAEIQLSMPLSSKELDADLITCPNEHTSHAFLACDARSRCWFQGQGQGESQCVLPGRSRSPPMFTCADEIERVPYTLVCDHRPDCTDGSDEDFCTFPDCQWGERQCDNKQCGQADQTCDGLAQCLDWSDEARCPRVNAVSRAAPPPPALITLDGRGSFTASEVNSTATCPETHFLCPGDGYCLPVYVRCNGVYDCPGREDEARCDSYTCPGFYRCRDSKVCLHPDHVCDGIWQCPQRDDERFCGVQCPESCTCYGHAFVCERAFNTTSHPQLRYLDARGSGMKPGNVTKLTMLVYLSLARCGLSFVDSLDFPSLHTLDLSDNALTVIHQRSLARLVHLHTLSLAGNPLVSVFPDTKSTPFTSMRNLDLSRVPMHELQITLLELFPDLQTLNLSDAETQKVPEEGFQVLSKLRVLDLNGCPVTNFPRNVFLGLGQLQQIHAKNFKLCCPAVLPEEFPSEHCHAEYDLISSCDVLLRYETHRGCLAVLACLALVGNLGSFVYRVFVKKVANNMGFGVFVTHLCVSDFLMGVYLAVIGVADRLYQGTYLWEDTAWKKSVACQVAGFLSLLSSEVSAFIICLITLDRFLAVRFPFSNFRFGKRSAHVASMVAWLLGIILAAIPLFPATSHWRFYEQTGICIPLPIFNKDFPGQAYSFGVTIVLNFLLFVWVAAGQILICWSTQTSTIASIDNSCGLSCHTGCLPRSATRTSSEPREVTSVVKDRTVACRLFAIVMTDFLCWFPVGLLGFLYAGGVSISGEVSVALAIVVIPFNAALNPFLYAISVLMEKRRIDQTQRLKKHFMAELQRAKACGKVHQIGSLEAEAAEATDNATARACTAETDKRV